MKDLGCLVGRRWKAARRGKATTVSNASVTPCLLARLHAVCRCYCCTNCSSYHAESTFGDSITDCWLYTARPMMSRRMVPARNGKSNA